MKKLTHTRTVIGSVFAWSLAAVILGAGLPARAQSTNIALGKPARQSSLSSWSRGDTDAQGAVDGVKNGSFGFHTNLEPNPSWQADLQGAFSLSEVRVFNRMDLRDRANGLEVSVSMDGVNWQSIYTHSGPAFGGFRGGAGDDPLIVRPGGAQARYVRLRIPASAPTYLHLDEVEVFGTAAGTPSATTATVRTQKATYAPNEAIVIEFTGLPGNQYDWVSIAKAGAPENEYEAGRWTYVNGERSGSRKLDGLPAGRYEARVYFNWSAGGFTIHARYPFTVGDTQPQNPPTAAGISGYWDSNFGVVAFVQSGNQVQGYYAYALGVWWGGLQGQVNGNVIEGTWKDGFGSGTFRFTFAADGRSFEGHFWHADGSDGGVWNGKFRAPLK
jgi:hypothetical protein